MRRFFLHLLAVLAVLNAVGMAAPMTVKELEFLVRQRTPEAEILRGVATRKLLVPLDAAGEKQLVASGASANLIAQLKSGNWVLDPALAQKELQRQNANQQRTMQEVEEAKARAKALNDRNTEIAARLRERGTVQRLLHDDLVYQDGGRLRLLDNSVINNVQVFAFLAASSSSGPSKQFMPKLLAAYKTLKEKYPEFEVIFISVDRDEFNMTEHMRTYAMPWPAVKFKQLPAEFAPFFGEGQPWFVLIGDDNKAISQNGLDQKFIEPDKLLDSIDQYLTMRRAKLNQ